MTTENANIVHFIVGFDQIPEQRWGVEAAAAQQLGITLRIETADRWIATRPGLPTAELAVDEQLQWLICTVMEEITGHDPAPFAVELEYPAPGQERGQARLYRREHPDATASVLSGAVLTDKLKHNVIALRDGYLGLVHRLAECRRRFDAGDYGDRIPEELAAQNQANRAADCGEVTGLYNSPDGPEPPLAISQYLPYEKGPIIMLWDEYHAVRYAQTVSNVAR